MREEFISLGNIGDSIYIFIQFCCNNIITVPS